MGFLKTQTALRKRFFEKFLPFSRLPRQNGEIDVAGARVFLFIRIVDFGL